ncbi:MAG: hypothetical protein OXI15_13530 [Chromatiales bacterium]|nr:hypothetical protein [Chromatiales bacterium]
MSRLHPTSDRMRAATRAPTAMVAAPPDRRPVTDRARVAAAILLMALAAGCARPLAVQHEFFEPSSGNADRIGTQTGHVVGHHRALQVVRHACGSSAAAPAPAGETNVPAGEGGVPAGPAAGFAAANRAALADLCADVEGAPAAAYGGTSNAYRRWVEDNVRSLPAASETAASAAGGS